MPVQVENESLPTIDELESMPPKRREQVNPEEFLDEVFEDGTKIYSPSGSK